MAMDTEERQEEVEGEVHLSELINTLRNRARGLKRNALISLGLMFLTLLGSMYIFIYAIQLTEIETFSRETANTRGEISLAKRKNVAEEALEKTLKESGTHIRQSLTADQQFISMIINNGSVIFFLAVR